MSKTNSNQQATSKGSSNSSLVFGVLSILTSLMSLVGIIFGIVAIVLGVNSNRKPENKRATAGIVTGIIGIVCSVLFVSVLFMAIPALQRTQRDSARRTDVSKTVVGISEYQSRNSGQLPSASNLSTNGLSQITSIKERGEPTKDALVYTVGVNCNNESSNRTASLRILLESGVEYCQDL